MTRPLAGIYKITNNKNGMVYVGQSQNVYEREVEHFVALRRGKHPNKMMQKDWNKDHTGFRFDVIEFVSLKELNEREKYWIDKLDTMAPHGYNQDWVPYKRKIKKPVYKQKHYRRSR